MSVSRPSLKILLCMFMEGGTCSLGRFDFNDGEDELTLVPAQGNGQYKRNLGNTVLTVLFTVPLITALYSIMWYQDLNTQVLQITSDTVVGLPYIPPSLSIHLYPQRLIDHHLTNHLLSSAQSSANFPSIALLQRLDWTSQAELLPKASKCFLGWYIYSDTMCASLSQSELSTTACNCNESWTEEVQEGFIWENVQYRYLNYQTPMRYVNTAPTYLMLLQAFFNCKSSPPISINPNLSRVKTSSRLLLRLFTRHR